jgi:membrane glycosyltransferase
MPARPWFGFLRGMLIAALPGLRRRAAFPAAEAQPWQAAARQRRRVLLAVVAALGVAAALLGPDAGIPEGLPLVLVSFLFAWVGTGLVTALMGAWTLWHGDAQAVQPAPHGPISRSARTAIIMPICNEDIATVFGGLRATCESLAATGALSLFDVYVLSDTPDPKLREAEMQAWRELRASLGDTGDGSGDENLGGRIFYRSRRHRVAKKAGNVADFLRRWGRSYRYMVVLDADSVMSGDALVSLVRTMEHNPRAGILQTLPQPLGHDTVHARAQQFAVRLSGRLFALGMAYWQLGESHYWGHNAILRVEPFMAHCRIAPLPGKGGLSGHILSHDFVEAALMRRAGYEVWLLPTLEGSWEQTPPNLLDELQRDRRWCQGNLQNARLIAEPGWRPAHRAMFATGALSYLVAPLWLALLASGAFVLSLQPATQGAALLLWALTATLLLLPRVLGLGTMLLLGEQHRYGGTWKLLASTVLEAGVSALQAPVRMLAHSSFIASALTGIKLEWRSPPRDAESVQWKDAFMRVGLMTVAALALVLFFLPGSSDGALPMLPILLPLALAVPMVVLTGNATLGAFVRRIGLLTVAEELRTPRPLHSARQALAFAALQPASVVQAPLQPRPAGRRLGGVTTASWSGAFAAVAAGIMVLAVIPRTASTPEPAMQSWRGSAYAYGQSLIGDPRMIKLASTTAAEPKPKRRVAPDTPARFIDDAVRARAMEAVRRTMGPQAYVPSYAPSYVPEQPTLTL